MHVLVYTSSPMLEELLQYSSLFELDFHYCYLPAQALAAYVRYKPSFFIVNCTNEDLQELDFLKSLSHNLPIFAVTTSTQEEVACQLLDEGADYLVRIPCGAKELHAQLKNFLRLLLHTQAKSSDVLHIGELKIYQTSNQVMLGGEFVPLTAKEYKLLLILAHNLNNIVSTEEIYGAVYPQNELNTSSRSLNMHLSNLRHKLHLEEFSHLSLETKRGKGFGLFYLNASQGGEQHE